MKYRKKYSLIIQKVRCPLSPLLGSEISRVGKDHLLGNCSKNYDPFLVSKLLRLQQTTVGILGIVSVQGQKMQKLSG